jgi:hypothetical protein
MHFVKNLKIFYPENVKNLKIFYPENVKNLKMFGVLGKIE